MQTSSHAPTPRAAHHHWPALAIGLWLLSGCGDGEHPPAPASAPGSSSEAPAPPAAGPLPSGHPALPPGHPTTGTPAGAASPSTGAPTGAPVAGGLTWTAGPPLVRRAPASRMRAAEYLVPDANQATETLLTVYYFGPGQGGSIDANLDRWIGQMSQPDGKSSREAAKIDKRRAGDVEITLLDVTGTYGGGMMGGGKSAGQRMLAAAATGPQGPVFFKLVGPAPTVGGARDAFIALLDSLAPAG